MPRGGKREGAGRPPKIGEIRKRRTLRATEEEWQLHLQFDRLIKYGDKRACIDFLKTQQTAE